MSQVTAAISNDQLNVENGYIASLRADAGLSLAKGYPLAIITSAAADAVFTLTVTNTPSSGNVQYSFLGETLTIANNDTAALLQAKLDTLYGEGQFTAGGGAWPGTPLTIAAKKDYKGLSITAPSQTASSLNASATVAVTTTTSGVAYNRVVAWDGSKITSPAAAISVSATGSGGTIFTGIHSVQATWYNANGETLSAPVAMVTLTAGQNIRVAAITSGNVPTGASGMNIYIDGIYAKQIALSSGAVPQTDIPGYDTALTPRGLPMLNTAYVYSDGRQTLAGFAKYAFQTDYKGRVKLGRDNPIGKSGDLGVEFVRGGIVNQSDLAWASGTESEAIYQLSARILSGTIAAGNAKIAFAPYGGVTR